MKVGVTTVAALLLVGLGAAVLATQGSAAAEPRLSVKQIMNGIITPSTATIWGAYDLKTDDQWKAVEDAAQAVIDAGALLESGGTGAGEMEFAGEEQWQEFNQQMVSAARRVLQAANAKEEGLLAMVGNDDLYPPCESCHRVYQTQ
jgi:cytochrome c556